MLSFVTWTADPTLLNLGPFTVRWYGLMFAIGFLVGYSLVARMFKHEGAPERWLGILLLWVMAGTVVGARLGHVFFYEWGYYSQHLGEIPKIWEGGLASHGGTLGVILGVFCFSWITSKRSPLWTFDRLCVAVPLVAGLIRLGNLFNHEIYGHATDVPWAFRFLLNPQAFHAGASPIFSLPSHPTQIYEAACYFALFGLLMWMYWRRNAEERPGLLLGVFFIGTFLPRFLIEYVKNVQEPWEASMALNMGQILSIPFVLAGIALVYYAMTHPRQHLQFPNRFSDAPKS